MSLGGSATPQRIESRGKASQVGLQRRADGVRNYLISIFEMQSGRLESIGRGEGSLLNPDNPNSSENRVVLIVNLGPGEG